MKLLCLLIFFMIFLARLSFGLDLNQSRKGLIILRNNEVLKGNLIFTNERDLEIPYIEVLPQGASDFIRIKQSGIDKIEFYYQQPNRLINRDFTKLDVWAYVYLNNGMIISMAYIDIISVLFYNDIKRSREFKIYDGMESVNDINTIKSILFYPDDILDALTPAATAKGKPVLHEKEKMTRTNNIFFRNGPKGRRVGKLSKGLDVKVLDQKGDWEKVQIEGWIHKKLLKNKKD